MNKHTSSTLIASAALVLASAALTGQETRSPKGWTLTVPARTTVKSAGELASAGVVVNLETFSALCLEPSASATFEVQGPETRTVARASNRNHVVFSEGKPALQQNPNKEPFYARAEGSISAFAWVDGKYSNATLTGEVNTDGGPGGKGSFSRQGLMARWDQGNNFYWFYVDFANGVYGILRSRFFGVMTNLPGSTGKIPNFKNNKTYNLEFDLNGDTMQGRIYEQNERTDKGTLVVETSKVQDSDPFLTGISGFLAEIAMEKPYEPLHASFGQLATVAQ